MIPMTLSINVRRGNKQAAVPVVAFGIVVVLIISHRPGQLLGNV
jgi:hypothetical protein